MSQSRTPLALLVGTAFAAGSLFSMQAMAQGYMQDARAEAGKHGHEGGCGVARMDADKDGRISRSEFAAAHQGSGEKFGDHDLNGDGFITQDELDKHHAQNAPAQPETQPEAKAEGEMKCGEGKCGGMR